MTHKPNNDVDVAAAKNDRRTPLMMRWEGQWGGRWGGRMKPFVNLHDL